jgi:hypothetical protein
MTYSTILKIRFQIDENPEELNKKMDDIALEMIDKIKKHVNPKQ